MSCWRRLREWQRSGLWRILQQLLIAKLPDAQKIDWSRAETDGESRRTVMGSDR
jgi:hypothetical protein